MFSDDVHYAVAKLSGAYDAFFGATARFFFFYLADDDGGWSYRKKY